MGSTPAEFVLGRPRVLACSFPPLPAHFLPVHPFKAVSDLHFDLPSSVPVIYSISSCYSTVSSTRLGCITFTLLYFSSPLNDLTLFILFLYKLATGLFSF